MCDVEGQVLRKMEVFSKEREQQQPVAARHRLAVEGDVTVSRRSFCHRSGGGEVAVHTFTPRRYLGGGFFLPGRPRTYSAAAFICTIRPPFHGSVSLFLSFCFCSLKKEIVLSDPISTATLRRCKAGSVGSIMTKVGEVPTCLGLGPASSLTKTETKMNRKTKAATFNASSENALTYFYFK